MLTNDDADNAPYVPSPKLLRTSTARFKPSNSNSRSYNMQANVICRLTRLSSSESSWMWHASLGNRLAPHAGTNVCTMCAPPRARCTHLCPDSRLCPFVLFRSHVVLYSKVIQFLFISPIHPRAPVQPPYPCENPHPYPRKTRTHAYGCGFWRVRVRVGAS